MTEPKVVTVHLTHPDEPDNTIEVEEDRVQLFKDSGWVEPEDKSKTSTTK